MSGTRVTTVLERYFKDVTAPKLVLIRSPYNLTRIPRYPFANRRSDVDPRPKAFVGNAKFHRKIQNGTLLSMEILRSHLFTESFTVFLSIQFS